MIFKKNNSDWSAPKNATPSSKTPLPQRREPAVSQTMSQTVNPTMPVTPQQSASQTRRGPAMAPAGFARNDQLRKLTVGRDISLNGEITTCDHLVVEGTVTATIKGGKILEITDTGHFSGVVDIEQADISGQFDGDLTVRGKLTIRATASVTGKIQYHQLQVDTGAAIKGELSMLEQQPPQRASSIPQQPQSTSPELQTQVSSGTDANRLYNFSSINSEPGFLKASA